MCIVLHTQQSLANSAVWDDWRCREGRGDKLTVVCVSISLPCSQGLCPYLSSVRDLERVEKE